MMAKGLQSPPSAEATRPLIDSPFSKEVSSSTAVVAPSATASVPAPVGPEPGTMEFDEEDRPTQIIERPANIEEGNEGVYGAAKSSSSDSSG